MGLPALSKNTVWYFGTSVARPLACIVNAMRAKGFAAEAPIYVWYRIKFKFLKNSMQPCQGNSTKGRVHRDAHEHFDVMGCEYQRTDWFIASHAVLWLVEWRHGVLTAQLHALPYVELLCNHVAKNYGGTVDDFPSYNQCSWL
jgi:hypothetical protein